MREDLLYFAYGSNLDLDGKLSQWAPSARLFGVGMAPRRRLAFTRLSTRWGARAADILPHSTAATWGALFSVDPADVEGIDACEGAPRNYRRVTIPVTTDAGIWTAFSYEVVDRHLPEGPPATAYMQAVLRGARAASLPADWITQLESIRTV